MIPTFDAGKVPTYTWCLVLQGTCGIGVSFKQNQNQIVQLANSIDAFPGHLFMLDFNLVGLIDSIIGKYRLLAVYALVDRVKKKLCMMCAKWVIVWCIKCIITTSCIILEGKSNCRVYFFSYVWIEKGGLRDVVVNLPSSALFFQYEYPPINWSLPFRQNTKIPISLFFLICIACNAEGTQTLVSTATLQRFLLTPPPPSSPGNFSSPFCAYFQFLVKHCSVCCCKLYKV